MAEAGERFSGVPKVKGEDDPGAPQLFLKEGFRAKHWSDDPRYLFVAGPNAMGEFIVVGNVGQVVLIPDEERVKLAACLLAGLLDSEPMLAEATKRLVETKAEREIDPQFRSSMTGKERGGVVARP